MRRPEVDDSPRLLVVRRLLQDEFRTLVRVHGRLSDDYLRRLWDCSETQAGRIRRGERTLAPHHVALLPTEVRADWYARAESVALAVGGEE